MTELTTRGLARPRSHFEIAAQIGELAERLARQAADDLVLSPEAQASFVILLRQWAAELDCRVRPEPVEDRRFSLAAELMAIGDRWNGIAAIENGIAFGAAAAAREAARLRQLALHAAHLELRASGFLFDPAHPRAAAAERALAEGKLAPFPRRPRPPLDPRGGPQDGGAAA